MNGAAGGQVVRPSVYGYSASRLPEAESPLTHPVAAACPSPDFPAKEKRPGPIGGALTQSTEPTEPVNRSDDGTSGALLLAPYGAYTEAASSAGGAALRIGSITEKMDPSAGTLATVIVPPSRSTSFRVMLRPSPVPPYSRVRD